jgi:hypothetical protein
VVRIVTWTISEAPFENVAFAPICALHSERDTSTNRMHQLRERCDALANDKVEVIRHHDICRELSIALLLRGRDNSDDPVAHRFVKPVLLARRARRQVKESSG